MKVLILIIALAANTAFANFVSLSGHNSGSPAVYAKKEKCKKAEGEVCYLVPNGYNVNYYASRAGKFEVVPALKASHNALRAKEKKMRDDLQSEIRAYDCEKLTGFINLLCKRYK